MTPAIHEVMLAISSSLAVSIVAKMAVIIRNSCASASWRIDSLPFLHSGVGCRTIEAAVRRFS